MIRGNCARGKGKPSKWSENHLSKGVQALISIGKGPLIREKVGNIEMLIAVVACSSAVHDGVAIYSCEMNNHRMRDGGGCHQMMHLEPIPAHSISEKR